MVKLLIANRAKVNAVDNNGATPLHLAAHFGLTKIAELLIANGANVNAVGKRGTPLVEAELGGSKDTIKLLISHGAHK